MLTMSTSFPIPSAHWNQVSGPGPAVDEVGSVSIGELVVAVVALDAVVGVSTANIIRLLSPWAESGPPPPATKSLSLPDERVCAWVALDTVVAKPAVDAVVPRVPEDVGTHQAAR
jgi:hypothetical protein